MNYINRKVLMTALILCIFSSCIKGNYKKFIIEFGTGAQSGLRTSFKVMPKTNKDHDIWVRLEDGILCTLGPWTHAPKASIECNGP